MLTHVGLDVGNGWIKVCIDGKASKVPAAYSLAKPEGAISQATGVRLKPKTFSVKYEGRDLWFGVDVLSSFAVIKELDEARYKKGYIQPLFNAVLVKWLDQHKVDPVSLGRLNILCSMPPGLYQDGKTRKNVIKAFRAALNINTTYYIQSSLLDSFRITSQFAGIAPEAASYINDKTTKSYLLLCDIGYGTVDYVVFSESSSTPIFTKSVNNGLVHLFANYNYANPKEMELEILRGKNSNGIVGSYLNTIKIQVMTIARTLQTRGKLRVVFLGGGVRLMHPDLKSELRKLFDCTFKDEFENARNNLKLAEKK